MKTRFDKYFEDHQGQFDVEIPDDDHIWKGISGELDRPGKIRQQILRLAAGLLLLVSISTVILLITRQRITAQHHDFALARVSEALGAEENAFHLLVREKLKAVEAATIDAGSYQQLMTELNQIDRQYAAYLDDLHTLGNQPRIIRGIIRCYAMKIKILEKTLNETAKNERHENKKNML
jgi:hypothetical protein